MTLAAPSDSAASTSLPPPTFAAPDADHEDVRTRRERVNDIGDIISKEFRVLFLSHRWVYESSGASIVGDLENWREPPGERTGIEPRLRRA